MHAAAGGTALTLRWFMHSAMSRRGPPDEPAPATASTGLRRVRDADAYCL